MSESGELSRNIKRGFLIFGLIATPPLAAVAITKWDSIINRLQGRDASLPQVAIDVGQEIAEDFSRPQDEVPPSIVPTPGKQIVGENPQPSEPLHQIEPTTWWDLILKETHAKAVAERLQRIQAPILVDPNFGWVEEPETIASYFPTSGIPERVYSSDLCGVLAGLDPQKFNYVKETGEYEINREYNPKELMGHADLIVAYCISSDIRKPFEFIFIRWDTASKTVAKARAPDKDHPFALNSPDSFIGNATHVQVDANGKENTLPPTVLRASVEEVLGRFMDGGTEIDTQAFQLIFDILHSTGLDVTYEITKEDGTKVEITDHIINGHDAAERVRTHHGGASFAKELLKAMFDFSITNSQTEVKAAIDTIKSNKDTIKNNKLNPEKIIESTQKIIESTQTIISIVTQKKDDLNRVITELERMEDETKRLESGENITPHGLAASNGVFSITQALRLVRDNFSVSLTNAPELIAILSQPQNTRIRRHVTVIKPGDLGDDPENPYLPVQRKVAELFDFNYPPQETTPIKFISPIDSSEQVAFPWPYGDQTVLVGESDYKQGQNRTGRWESRDRFTGRRRLSPPNVYGPQKRRQT